MARSWLRANMSRARAGRLTLSTSSCEAKAEQRCKLRRETCLLSELETGSKVITLRPGCMTERRLSKISRGSTDARDRTPRRAALIGNWCMHRQKVKEWNIEELPETMALSQHYALRQRRPPSAGNLSALPAPITWDYGFAPPRPPLMKAYALPQWREGYGNDPKRIPAWWQ